MVRVPQVRDLCEEGARNSGKGMKVDIVNSGLAELVRRRETAGAMGGKSRKGQRETAYLIIYIGWCENIPSSRERESEREASGQNLRDRLPVWDR